MRILLTGGAGYVGSACLRWLLSCGHEPIAFDNLSEGNRAAIPADRLVEGDIEDCAALTEVIRDHNIEVVMHFAAVALVSHSITQPELYWRTNVIGTKNVLDAMRATGVGKLLVSSTAATYSYDVEIPITEETPTAPQTPYGTSKLASEQLVAEYARAYGLSYAILRYFNAAGADPDGEHGEDRKTETHLIPLALRAALGKEEVKLYGTDWSTPDGSCVRDFVHTEDLARAHQLVAEKLKPGDANVYNIACSVGTSIIQILKLCEEITGSPIPHKISGRRPGDPASLVASFEKLQTSHGWEPQHNIRSILESAWRWQRKYPNGYADKKKMAPD